MQHEYRPDEVESTAQKFWQDNNSFHVVEDPNKEKFFCLSMFPYPSGQLHRNKLPTACSVSCK